MSNSYALKSGVTVRLPALTDTPALQEASADDLRILLCLSLSGYTASVDTLAKQSGLSLTRAAAAVEYWLAAGIIEEEPHAKPPLTSQELLKGTAAEDARVIEEQQLRDCLDACAQILGRLLNTAEINTLVAIIHSLGVSESYLTTLLDFCVNTLGKKNIKYLEKVALTLSEEGVTGDAALDEYIKRYEFVHSHEGQIRRLWGLGSRALTDRENAMLERWFVSYGYDMDVIGAAYDITANTAAKVTLGYADKILEDWHRRGLKTLPEVEAYLAAAPARANSGSAAAKKSSGGKKPSTSSFDVNSFFESALERSYGKSTDQTDQKG